MLHNYMIILIEYVLLTLRQLHVCFLDFRQPQLTSSIPPRNPISSFPLPQEPYVLPQLLWTLSTLLASVSFPCVDGPLSTLRAACWNVRRPLQYLQLQRFHWMLAKRQNSAIPQAPPHSAALSSFHPLSDVSLGLSTYSHLLPALWVSALTAAHHKKRRLWPWLRTVPIRGQKHPEGSMTTCSLEYQQ